MLFLGLPFKMRKAFTAQSAILIVQPVQVVRCCGSHFSGCGCTWLYRHHSGCAHPKLPALLSTAEGAPT